MLARFLRAWRQAKKQDPLPFNVNDHAQPVTKNIDLTIEAAAIHRATEVINKRIARGDFKTQEEMRQAVLEEFSFQKIALHEEL